MCNSNSFLGTTIRYTQGITRIVTMTLQTRSSLFVYVIIIISHIHIRQALKLRYHSEIDSHPVLKYMNPFDENLIQAVPEAIQQVLLL